MIDPEATYWQYGFPGQVISILGADFTFAVGTIYIAKVALPHEQSVAAALFQSITALGTSVGLAVVTVAQVAGMKSEAKKLGLYVAANSLIPDIPPPVLLKGYRYAHFATFAFGACGELNFSPTGLLRKR